MGTIEIHDGVTSRDFTVQSLQGTVEIHATEKRIVVPAGFDVETRDPETLPVE